MPVLSGKPIIGRVDKPASRLAIGTGFYRPDAQDQRFEILDRFRELGGTVIDTGRHYGESEVVVGNWLESRNAWQDMLVTTKCCHGPGILTEDFDEVMDREIEQSLEYLKTDCVDVYMLHRDNPEIPVARIIDKLNEKIADNKTKAIAASNWDYDRVEEANSYARDNGLAGFTLVSNNISLAKQKEMFFPGLVQCNEEGVKWHRENNVPIMSWSSQARGFFTGKWTREMRDDIDKHEGFDKRMLEVYATDENLARLARAQELAKKKGDYTAVEIALAWLINQDIDIIPVVGCHTVGELESCAKAVGLKLSPEELVWLESGD